MEPSAFHKQEKLIKKLQEGIQSILITGPTGSGKDYLARKIHCGAMNRNSVFIAVNCSTIPYTLFESHLFGHKKGSFTGAQSDSAGYCGKVAQGTLFLDEIGDLPIECQPKLLRLLENRTFIPVGSAEEQPFYGRIIAATHKDLKSMVEEGAFREDLYHRLSIFHLETSPLSDQLHTIPDLVESFFSEKEKTLTFSQCAINLLKAQRWHGNIRELRNVMERIFLLHEECTIDADSLKEYLPCSEQKDDSLSLDTIIGALHGNKLIAIEQLLINYSLKKNRGNKSATARELGVERKHFERRLRYSEQQKGAARELLWKLWNSKEVSEEMVQQLEQKLVILQSLVQDNDVVDLEYQIATYISRSKRKIHGWGSEKATVTSRGVLVDTSVEEGGDTHYLTCFGSYLINGEIDKAVEFARNSFDEAEKESNTSMLITASVTLANALYWQGNTTMALTQLQRCAHYFTGTSLPNSEEGAFIAVIWKMLSFMIHSHRENEIEAAVVEEELEKCIGKSSPYVQAAAYQAIAWGFFIQGKPEFVESYADHCISISKENSYTQYYAIGLTFKAYSVGLRFDFEEAKELLREASSILSSVTEETNIVEGLVTLVEGEIALSIPTVSRKIGDGIEQMLRYYKNKNSQIYVPHLQFLKLRLQKESVTSAELHELLSLAQKLKCNRIIKRIKSWWEGRDNECY